MRLLRGIQGATVLKTDTVATIGNFDGVHGGHRALLQALKTIGQQKKLPTLVVLFEPQPHEYFRGTSASARLTNFKEKWRILSQFNIDYVCCLPFNTRLSRMSADDFARQLIFSSLRVNTLLMGEDFRFGAGRLGDLSLLKHISKEMGATLQVYSDFVFQGARISSTRIRQSLKAGKLNDAAKLLGRPYSMYGRVVMGAQLGRTFGVPTANINPQRLILPMTGVFCVKVKRSNGLTYEGVANLGRRPTVDGLTNRLEVHLFDFEGSLYHEHLEVFFLHQLRGEVKFPSLEALIAQIKADIVEARALFPRLVDAFPV
ncbi:MAG: bifunctional riboflavin kinase/FAD synthetase [Legionellaceae bacterium]|nr:bifunctional riboflavin kinase/FAD synthetase [Legionellaceae bacterium]